MTRLAAVVARPCRRTTSPKRREGVVVLGISPSLVAFVLPSETRVRYASLAFLAASDSIVPTFTRCTSAGRKVFMADWTWSTQPSPSVAFRMITSNSRVLAGEDLGAVELRALEDLHQFSFAVFADEGGRGRNLPAATIVSQHFAASSADVHFSSQAFSTTGASLVVLTILISGFSGLPRHHVGDGFVASATAASVACALR